MTRHFKSLGADTLPSVPRSTPDEAGPSSGRTGAAGENTQVQPVVWETNDPPAMPAAPVFEVHVFGTPAPQGSKHGRPIYKGRSADRVFTGKVAQVESSPNVKPWREAVKHAALAAIAMREGTGAPFVLIGSPVYVETTYTFARPKSHYRTGRYAHLLRDDAPLYPVQLRRNDIEKLTRASRDALSDAGVWVDDALVVDERNRKVYPGTHPDALPVAGAVIRIFVLPLDTRDA